MEWDPYEELGVGRGASDEDIKRAFRRRILATHPDRNGATEANSEAFRRAKASFEAIMRERAGGDLPPWAEELLANWTRARAAAERGNFGAAADEMKVLVGTVVEHVDHVSTTARAQYEEVRRTVRAIGQLFGAKPKRPRRRSS